MWWILISCLVKNKVSGKPSEVSKLYCRFLAFLKVTTKCFLFYSYTQFFESWNSLTDCHSETEGRRDSKDYCTSEHVKIVTF